jgi:hypothetical protein
MPVPASLGAGHAVCTDLRIPENRMKSKMLIAVLVCLALAACEPRGTPQKPKTIEHAVMFQPSGL